MIIVIWIFLVQSNHDTSLQTYLGLQPISIRLENRNNGSQSNKSQHERLSVGCRTRIFGCFGNTDQWIRNWVDHNAVFVNGNGVALVDEAHVFQGMDSGLGRVGKDILRARIVFATKTAVVGLALVRRAVRDTVGQHQGIVGGVAAVVTGGRGTIGQAGVALLGDEAALAVGLELVEGFLHRRGEFVVQAVVVVRLNDQKVDVAVGFRLADVGAVVVEQKGFRVKNGLRVGAINLETKFRGLRNSDKRQNGESSQRPI